MFNTLDNKRHFQVIISNNKSLMDGKYIEGIKNFKGAIKMPQNIDVNQLNQAKANVTLTQTLLSQAIEKSSSDPTLAQEAIKQAANEITSALTAVNQVQGTSSTKKSQ